MKILIASDIHGSAYWCRKVLEMFRKKEADVLLLLGDILYHGPRNDLPKEYAPKEVIAMLNPLSDSIVCCRGNCEAEVDQMVLDFPCMADYETLSCGKVRFFATHGHLWNMENPPEMGEAEGFVRGDVKVLLNGHTHRALFRECDGFCFANPGSASIPKEGERHSVIFFEDGKMQWLDLESGEIYMEEQLPDSGRHVDAYI